MSYYRSVFIFGLILLWLPSCTYLKRLVGISPLKPRVKLEAVQVEKISLNAIDLNIVVVVTNPNDFDIVFDKLTYKAEAFGAGLGEGRYNKTTKVLAQKTANLSLPLKVQTGALFKLFTEYLKNPAAIKVLVIASINIKTPLGDFPLTLKEEKKLK